MAIAVKDAPVNFDIHLFQMRDGLWVARVNWADTYCYLTKQGAKPELGPGWEAPTEALLVTGAFVEAVRAGRWKSPGPDTWREIYC